MPKGLKALKHFSSEIRYWYPDIVESRDIVEKELKALEIVKKKSGFSFWDFKHCDNVDEYNELYNTRDNRLTQEEFDLLKEVLEE